MKKCAVINDLSGFGKCSLTASIPILSAMGCEVHPLVTAVLSNQTAYDSFKSFSLTDTMSGFIDEWKKLSASFDAVLTGFVTDERQLDIISGFIDDFKTDSTIVVVVDPVMADNGRLYDGYTKRLCDKVKKLCFKADIITPNTSELSIIAGEPNCKTLDDVIRCGNSLVSSGIEKIVVTGLEADGEIINTVFENGNVKTVRVKQTGGYYSGTGDVFASVITGAVLRGMTLYDATVLACEFIKKSIEATDVINHNDGISFEKNLGDLI
ncbi:MAG: pyridoxamine kinase [Eubacterium sp.]